MIDLTAAREQLRRDLGYRPLSRTWAKLEILLGLTAVALGILVMVYWGVIVRGSFQDWLLPAGGASLFVFGGYLALSGHRSHLYQSFNDSTAYLLRELRNLNDKGPFA